MQCEFKSAQHLYTVGTVVLQSTDVFVSFLLLLLKCRGKKKHPTYSLSIIITHLFTASLISQTQLSFYLASQTKWQRRKCNINVTFIFSPRMTAVQDILSLPVIQLRCLAGPKLTFVRGKLVICTGSSKAPIPSPPSLLLVFTSVRIFFPQVSQELAHTYTQKRAALSERDMDMISITSGNEIKKTKSHVQVQILFRVIVSHKKIIKQVTQLQEQLNFQSC